MILIDWFIFVVGKTYHITHTVQHKLKDNFFTMTVIRYLLMTQWWEHPSIRAPIDDSGNGVYILFVDKDHHSGRVTDNLPYPVWSHNLLLNMIESLHFTATSMMHTYILGFYTYYFLLEFFCPFLACTSKTWPDINTCVIHDKAASCSVSAITHTKYGKAVIYAIKSSENEPLHIPNMGKQ